MKRQTNLEGEVLRDWKLWKHMPKLEEPGTEDVDVDDFPILDIDLKELAETPIWECFKSNPLRTVDGSILVGNCGVPGYTREACWQPILDDLCVSCTYHYENDPEEQREYDEGNL